MFCAGEPAQHPLHLQLALGLGQVDEPGEPLVLGDVGEQRVDVGDADLGQHGAAVGIGERQVAHRSGFPLLRTRRLSTTTSVSTELAMKHSSCAW